MASVISILPRHSLTYAFGDRSFDNSRSSIGTVGPIRATRPHRSRQLSSSSCLSEGSLRIPLWQSLEDRIPIRPASTIGTAGYLSPKRISALDATYGALPSPVSPLQEPLSQRNTQLVTSPSIPNTYSPSPPNIAQQLGYLVEENTSGSDVWYDPPETEKLDGADRFPFPDQSSQENNDFAQPQRFQRWVSTLRRRRRDPQGAIPILSPVSALGKSPARSPLTPRHVGKASGHGRSGSLASSMAFVTGMRPASLTIASSSEASMSQPHTGRSPRTRLWTTSSALSRSEMRRSTDSTAPSILPLLDEAARKRSRKRWEKIEEIVKTEEGYLADLKALTQAYHIILLPHADLSPQAKTALTINLPDLVQLHDELLRDLHYIVPTFGSSPIRGRTGTGQIRHGRWKSADGAFEVGTSPGGPVCIRSNRRSLNISRSSEPESSGLHCSPQTAADLAKAFLSRIRRFSAYEEYGARCGMLHNDIDSTQKTLPFGLEYDRAIETLYSSVNPIDGRTIRLKRALGLKDLLIKPVQRITRYELLFKELCALTPSCDDPTSHSVLDDTLYAMSQICHGVNESKDNPERLRLLEIQSLLQERLEVHSKISRPLLFNFFGRLSLCGSLYIAYRTRSGIKGQYVICVLYESCLIFADASCPSKYNVLATAPTGLSKLEEADSGKGLQCHTTSHTWKLTFENNGRIFELLMVACSAVEASVWRDRIAGRIAVETKYLAEGHATPVDVRSPLTDEMRSIGKAYGKGSDFPRRLSVQRAATLGATTEINQVIIKNTQTAREPLENTSTSSLPIPRSISLATPSHIPVLAPRRSDRIQLEHNLSDVWTKDSLPWPGLGTKRPEYNIRASANHVIRKLSMASIASNFSKRSLSYASIGQAQAIDSKPQKPPKPVRLKQRPPIPPESAQAAVFANPREQKEQKEQRPPINFHTAPEAFLPEDFELHASRARGRLAGLRTFTMTTDRSRSPMYGSEDKAPGIKRSRSVLTRRPPQPREMSDSTRLPTPQPHLQRVEYDTDTSRTNERAGRQEVTQDRPTARLRARSKLMKLLG